VFLSFPERGKKERKGGKLKRKRFFVHTRSRGGKVGVPAKKRGCRIMRFFDDSEERDLLLRKGKEGKSQGAVFVREKRLLSRCRERRGGVRLFIYGRNRTGVLKGEKAGSLQVSWSGKEGGESSVYLGKKGDAAMQTRKGESLTQSLARGEKREEGSEVQRSTENAQRNDSAF